jgi:hypothetical protein
MGTGVNGNHGVQVMSPVVVELDYGQGCVITLHHLMEENSAQDLLQTLAVVRKILVQVRFIVDSKEISSQKNKRVI